MEAVQMEQALLQQQQQQEKLADHINMLHQQLAEQEVKVRQLKATKFNLTPDQIIRNFNEISPFCGENSYKLKSFLKAVEDVEQLCGDNNDELKQYCLKKLINNKIIGCARNIILEIPDHQRTWNNIISQLKLRYRPKNTIHQLLYKAKEIRVSDIKDLFSKLGEVKSKCSEICDFDEEESFTYDSIDRELVQIFKSKIVPILQIQIDNTKSLFELDNILCQSEIYISEDVIKSEFKSHKNNQNHKSSNYKSNQNYNKNFSNNKYNNNSNQNNFSNQNNSPNNNFSNKNNLPNNNSSNQNNFPNNNYRGNNNNYRGPYQNNYNNNNSGQYKKPYVGNTSGQYGNYNNNNSKPAPMEVDTIVQEDEIEQEVNFHNEPRSIDYP